MQIPVLVFETQNRISLRCLPTSRVNDPYVSNKYLPTYL